MQALFCVGSAVECDAVSRILGIDFGHKRIGVALSDALGISASALCAIERKGGLKDIATLQELIQEHEVHLVVMGLPLKMDGGISDQAKQAQAFAKLLKQHTKIPVQWVDERLSSVQAEKQLNQAKRKPRPKTDVDQAAACIILQQYLDTQAFKKDG